MCCLPSWFLLDPNTALASSCVLCFSQWFPMQSCKSFLYFNSDLTVVKFVWKSRFIRTDSKVLVLLVHVWHWCSSCMNTPRLVCFLLTRLITYLLTHGKVFGGGSFARVFQEGPKVIQGHTFPVGVPSQTAVQLAHITCMNRSLLNPLTTGAQVHFTKLQSYGLSLNFISYTYTIWNQHTCEHTCTP